MALPFFYIEEFDPSQRELALNEDTSKHIVQVLRMKEGENLNLTDGKGILLEAKITEAHRKHCQVNIQHSTFKNQHSRHVTIAMSLLKNTSRFEWFSEKATEIGVSAIIPLICDRTEQQKFRSNRLKEICVSAMLQSQQVWLPQLNEPMKFNHLVSQPFVSTQKLIAHCDQGIKSRLTGQPADQPVIILIGPEGDFTKDEIMFAIQQRFTPVSMGETRLRTETAGLVATALLCFH